MNSLSHDLVGVQRGSKQKYIKIHKYEILLSLELFIGM